MSEGKKCNESMDDFLIGVGQDLEDNPPWSEKQEKCWNDFLEDLSKKDNDNVRKHITERAFKKEYHDFESETSKFAMENDLRIAGYKDMRENCIKGKYDF